jgi:type II secretory pathway pseudopilin PulG
VRRAVRRRLSGEDAGYSLVDLLVAMSVMSILMVVVIRAVAEVYSNVTRTEGTSFAREEIGNSFRRLDKELRYATWISAPPGKDGTTWDLWYALPPTGSATDYCRRLMFDTATGILSLEWWDATDHDEPTRTGKIATDLTLVGTAAPFTVITPNSTIYSSIGPAAAGVGKAFAPDYYQVRFLFNATFGKVSLREDIYFTAQNTNGGSTRNSKCDWGQTT